MTSDSRGDAAGPLKRFLSGARAFAEVVVARGRRPSVAPVSLPFVDGCPGPRLAALVRGPAQSPVCLTRPRGPRARPSARTGEGSDRVAREGLRAPRGVGRA